jgi:hypothetical protein
VALPQGDEKVRAVRAMFDTIAPRYDLVNRIMTMRLDVRWRRLAVRSLGLPRRLVAIWPPAPVICASNSNARAACTRSTCRSACSS